jgi:ATP phosphoribosyltransferase regulatory subunit
MPSSTSRPWQLPDGIDELLPAAAGHVERLRRDLLDTAARWGYRLVVPPMLEYTDSLLVGVGEDLDLLTFKVPDQLSGRMLGLRADMTPQVARIDAHSLGGEGVNRLCYAGSTLHTRARSLAASRSPLQLGAELYGDASATADLEVIALMLAMFEAAGLEESSLTLDLGHGNLFTAVLEAAGIEEGPLSGKILDAIQRKSRPDLATLVADLAPSSAGLLTTLLELHGGTEVLDRAEAAFARIPGVLRAVEDIRGLVRGLAMRRPDLSIYIDLAELRGYRYHTGVVFAAYARGLGEALGRGGRYDNVGAVHGSARPATGFATDLRLLAAQVPFPEPPRDAIAAPALDDETLNDRIHQLRAAGETVIVSLGAAVDPRCRKTLTLRDGAWQIEDLVHTEKDA